MLEARSSGEFDSILQLSMIEEVKSIISLVFLNTTDFCLKKNYKVEGERWVSNRGCYQMEMGIYAKSLESGVYPTYN